MLALSRPPLTKRAKSQKNMTFNYPEHKTNEVESEAAGLAGNVVSSHHH
jgi:hypothetical protein